MLHRTLPLVLLLAGAPLAPSTAAAARSSDALSELQEDALPEIEETGITAFDSVFLKVRAIHETLGKVEARLIGAQDQIAAAVGLEPGTPIRTSMWELKQKVGGPVEVQLRDGKPYLTVGGTGTQEVNAAVAAVEEAGAELARIPLDLAPLPAQVQELVAAAQQFPSQLNPQLLQEAGMNPLQLPKVAKTVASNVKATVATPKRIESLVEVSKAMVTGIPEGLAATEPPSEAVAGKSKSKSKGKGKGKSSETMAPAGLADLPPSPVGNLVASALTAFHDAEVAQAVRILGQADASLATMTSPVPVEDLQTLYQTQALVHLVDGNAAAASASVAQALVVDPEADAIKDLGPEYGKLHKLLSKAEIVRTVRVEIRGEGRAYISGMPVDGGSYVDVAAGKHLVQVQRGESWTSRVVWISDGYVVEL